jgi:peptidoglycan/LPS O-acetylase OafA/YrhL
VQLFFALSGFLICERMLREEDQNGSISLRSFYTRRLFRIQPAALLYLAVIAVLGLSGAIPRFWPGIVGAALMVRNMWPLQQTPGAWYTAHFWSLAVEVHFYLLLPVFLVLVRRHRLAILTLTALLLEAWKVYVLTVPPTWHTLQRTDLVLDGILLGSLLTVALRQERILRAAQILLRPWVAIGYGVLLFLMLQRHNSSFAQTSLMTLFPLLVGSTVLHPGALLSRLLELAPVRFVGRISYSLYLWQQLFFNPERVSAHVLETHPGLRWIAATVCALASYYLIETPLIRIGHRIAKRFDLRRRGSVELAA